MCHDDNRSEKKDIEINVNKELSYNELFALFNGGTAVSEDEEDSTRKRKRNDVNNNNNEYDVIDLVSDSKPTTNASEVNYHCFIGSNS